MRGNYQLNLVGTSTVYFPSIANSYLGQIAFWSIRNSSRDIYIINTNGTEERRVTNTGGVVSTAIWSPDGTRITFSSYDFDSEDFEIYSINVDGTNLVNLTNHPSPDSGAAWSPDGSQVAFSSSREGNYEIYTINPDGRVNSYYKQFCK